MDKTMKFISWNVNGLRACMQKGFLDFFNEVDADFFCVQETKLQEGQIALDLPGYHQFWNYAEKKGYSGTAIFTKHEPLSVSYGIGIPEHDHEGRVITLEYDAFYLVTCYTPNSQNELARLPYRMQWEEDFLAFLKRLDEVKPVIVCGDLNVAHEEIDLKNPKTNRKNAGFSDEERAKMTTLLNSGFTDTFRYFIRIKRASTPGGLTGSRHVRRTLDGVLTILSLPDVLTKSCSLPESIRKCTALTIVRWNLLQTSDAVIICVLTSFRIR